MPAREGTASLCTLAVLDDGLEHQTNNIPLGKTAERPNDPEESIPSHSKVNGIATFEAILQLSRVYRSTRGEEIDPVDTKQSLISNPWSVCSTSSLAEISNISVFALPIYPGDFGIGTSLQDTQAWHGTMDLEVKRLMIRDKILAIGRMSIVYNFLRESDRRNLEGKRALK